MIPIDKDFAIEFYSKIQTIATGISIRDGEERAFTKMKWKGKKKANIYLRAVISTSFPGLV